MDSVAFFGGTVPLIVVTSVGADFVDGELPALLGASDGVDAVDEQPTSIKPATTRTVG